MLLHHTHRAVRLRVAASAALGFRKSGAYSFFVGGPRSAYSGGGGGRGKDDNDVAEEPSEDDGQAEIVPPSALSVISIGEKAPRPPHLLAVPIHRRPLFPSFMMPLVVNDEALVRALAEIKKTPSPWVGVFLAKDPTIDLNVEKFTLKSVDQIHRVGTLCHIQQLEAIPGGVIAMIMSHRRIMIKEAIPTKAPPLVVRVEHISQRPLDQSNPDQLKAMTNEILSTLREIIKINPLFQQHVSYFARSIDINNPYSLADFAASVTSADAKELQEVLDTFDLEQRLQKALLLLKHEQQLNLLQQTIKQDTEKRIDKSQRQYFLMEQLKSIKKELGLEKDDKDALVTKFQERVAGLKMPASAKTVFDEELEKLQVLERNSSEFNVTRTYLDWLTSIPWGKYSADNFDIALAKKILDEDHYGMGDVKDRILEFIAVGKLKGSVQGKILCFVGPPGVGKTSIGKSIARSLNRQFFRFSVGGLNDVAEIKGHRRTYIGAMPGKLIQCMKSTGVSNPLVLIDEIDKIGHGRGYSGDPSSALLEMLDPNQNATFMDHYLDTPVDASTVLFICTANTLDTIPGPLLDRMEVIRLAGYDQPEKLQIAQRYLDPKTRSEMGLVSGALGTPASLRLEESALEHLIRWYAREAGVRNLEKLIGKIYRKAAIKIVQARETRIAELREQGLWPPQAPNTTLSGETVAEVEVHNAAVAEGAEPASAAAVPGSSDVGGASGASPAPPSAPAAEGAAASDAGKPPAPAPSAESGVLVEDPSWTITASNLESYLGKPTFTSDRLYATTPPGVVMGLAWTTMGGAALYIECVSPFLREHSSRARKSKHPRSGGDNTVIAGDAIDDEAGGREGELPPPNPVEGPGGEGEGSRKRRGPHTIEEPSSASDEDNSRPSGGSLRLTGKLGEVMQESAQIAYTVARRLLRTLPGQEGNTYLHSIPLHMHVPEGSTPKDGPSAGVTMVTALLSIAMDKAVRADMAMTGEVTLTGKVLPVGGIKEKVMASRRAQVTCLVLPAGNRKDYEELPEHLVAGLEVHFAEDYREVAAVAFPGVAVAVAAPMA